MSHLLDESRYDRQERITWWDQARLRDARVLVVGAGALGNEVVKNLALVGIGTIEIIDFDAIEPSNLARCVFFRASDRGRNKAEVVAARAAELNEEISVHGSAGDIREFGTAAIAEYDVLVGALDNREARLTLNHVALRAGVPWIDGAIEGLQGVARVFPGVDEACYECTLHAADWQDIASRRACTLLTREELSGGRTPTTATTSSVIGAVQAQEVIRLLHGDRLPAALNGSAFVFNGAGHDHYVTRYPVNPHCTAHERLAVEAAEPVLGSLSLAALRALTDAPEASIELERERVAGWRCRCSAGNEECTPRPLTGLDPGAAECPACALPRTPVLLGILDDARLAGPAGALTIADLRLPANDLIVLRTAASARVFVTPGATA